MADSMHVTGLSDLQQFLDTLTPKLEANIMRGALRAGMKPVQTDAKARVEVVSGQLRDGLKISTRIKGGTVMARLRATGKHAYVAHWVEFGTAPHYIKPKKAKALAVAGGFSEVVHHPGARPYPFMRPALDSQAQNGVVAAAEYMKKRLATKEGLDTADIDIEVEA